MISQRCIFIYSGDGHLIKVLFKVLFFLVRFMLTCLLRVVSYRYETNRKQRSTPLGVDGTASHPESRRIIQEVEGHAGASQQGQDQQLQSQPAAAAPAPVSVAAGARVPDVVPAALAETEAAAMASTSAR